MRGALVAALLGLATLTLSCQVNEYCIGCDPTGDAGTGDGSDAGDDGDGGTDAGGGMCVPSGVEVCDGTDNDCDGKIDEGPLPDVGEMCMQQTGECMGAVKQCVNGAIKCSTEPTAERCDGKDNNCNGLIDEGDPGGGKKCGTDFGECVAGTEHCVNGVVECVGFIDHRGDPELCDGKDNDCDDQLDEGLMNMGPCGASNVGECKLGTLMCIGGGPICVGDVGPTFELCDDKDQDCDGFNANGYDLDTDPLNCGMCGRACSLPNAFEGCAGGACTVAACQPGYYNNNNDPFDGCEYGPCTIQGSEVCNGVDDNCNGSIDEGVTPPASFCLSAGECATGTTVTCNGLSGFQCTYSDPDVSLDANGNITPETLCDGKDNDCDGKIDEGQPNVGQTCDNSQPGDCRSTGTFQCDAANPNGPAICVITTQGPGMSAEVCDGRDNNCDGIVDNGASTGNLTGIDWITIPGTAVQIMKWEASRPNATAASGGSLQTHACSRQGVQPWTNVTYPQAVAACNAVGARLCTEAEWQSMCAQPPTASYPMAGPTGSSDFVFIEAEQAQANVSGTSSGTTRSFVADTTSSFSGVRALIALPNTGGNISNTSAPTQSPRLDFQVNFQQTGNHFVWVRLYAESSGDNAVWTGINATAGASANGTQLAPPSTMLQTWVWVVSPAFNITSTGNQFVSVFMRRDGVRVDAIAISKDGTNLPPFNEKIWAYQNNPKIAQDQICNDDEYDTVPGGADQDDILPTGTLPQCFANGPGAADAFDLSGNVKEWTTARAPGQNPIRGGASNNEVNGLTCQLNFTLADDTFFFPNVGFRCCR